MLNEDKIKEIYHDLAPKLTNYLVASGMDYASACDITQECFMRLWKQREIIEESSSIGSLSAQAPIPPADLGGPHDLRSRADHEQFCSHWQGWAGQMSRDSQIPSVMHMNCEG